MSMSRTWDVGRPLGRPVGSVIGRAIGRVSGAVADDLAADVRALFSANGGDFTGTMLDFTDSTALWQDTGATTQAGDGDTLARVDDQSGEGNNATQATAAERPSVTTDAFGTLVASPDGVDDNMDLPDGVLGGGTDHVHVFAAYALDNANSDTSPCVIGGTTSPPNYGLISSHVSTDGQPQFAYSDSATAGNEVVTYARALTDHETVVRSDLFDPGASAVIRINGAEVARDESIYAAIDDPGVATLFGRTTTANLAGTCHAIVVLTGSRAMTSDEIATVETWLASLANDPLLTAEADTVLQRLFTPATDLNYTADWSSDLDGWVDASTGGGSVAASGGSLVLTNGGGTASARKLLRVRVGHQYQVSITLSGGNANLDIDETAYTGTGTYANDIAGGSETYSFVATTEYVYVQIADRGSDITTESFSLTEIAATGEWWDLLDTTKLYSDPSTLAEAEDSIQFALPKHKADIYGPSLLDAPNVAGNWTAYGSNTVEQDGDEVKITYVDATIAADIDISGSPSFSTTNLTAGVPYRLTLNARVNTGTVQVRVGTSATGTTTVSVDSTTADELEFIFVSDGLETLQVRAMGSGEEAWVEVTSLKEITGYPLQQSTAASRPALDATGTFIEFDGVDDYFEAVDPNDDLAIVGDLTIVSAVDRTAAGGTAYVITNGVDTSITVNQPFGMGTLTAGQHIIRQCDGTNNEFEQSSYVVPTGADSVLSAVRDGTAADLAIDTSNVESFAFATVTTPTTGVDPLTAVGALPDGTRIWEGSIKQLLIADRALSTGLLLHMERAITEKIA